MKRDRGGTRSADPVFAERFEPLRRPIEAHCHRMFGDALDAEEATQEALLRALRDAQKQLEQLRKTPARLRLRERITGLDRRIALANESQRSARSKPGA